MRKCTMLAKANNSHVIFDFQLDASLSPGVSIGQFVSKNYRYFRLNPRLHDCYVDIVYHENKRFKTSGKLQAERGNNHRAR